MLSKRGLSLHVEIESTNSTGLNETSYVQCELLRSINKDRLTLLVGTIDTDTDTQIRTIVTTLLGL